MQPLTFDDFIAKIRPIFDAIVWSCRPGVGSFITDPAVPERVRKLSARRRAQVVGDWSIWIAMCEWTLVGPDVRIHWDQDGSAHDAARALDARRLLDLTVDGLCATMRFEDEVQLVMSPVSYVDHSEVRLSLWSISDHENGVTYALDYVHGLSEERS